VSPEPPRRDPERRLPPDILALADWRDGEAAFRRADLPRVAAAAARMGFACSGGQVQVRLPDATAELYWQDFDPADRRAAEDWPAYVERSWKEALFLAAGLPADPALVGQARQFKGLEDIPETKLQQALWFVVYLAKPG
jgi:hypothetical protein